MIVDSKDIFLTIVNSMIIQISPCEFKKNSFLMDSELEFCSSSLGISNFLDSRLNILFSQYLMRIPRLEDHFYAASWAFADPNPAH